MEILNESAFKKIIFWLICPLLVAFSIGNAAALYSATESQTATITATNGDASYAITQSQTAEASAGSGGEVVNGPNIVSSRTLDTPGAVVTRAVATQTQSVVNPSTDYSTNEIYSSSTPSHQVDKINTAGTDSTILTQTQSEVSVKNENIYQKQTTSLTVVSTPSGRVIGIIHQMQ